MGQVFDPVFIVMQIVALQCSFYLAMGTILGLAHIVLDTPVSMDHFFSPNFINFVSISGWFESLCTVLASIAGAYLLSIIVERSKKCVDFTFTLYFIHIFICMLYQEFPLVWEWWAVNVVSSVVMASLGEYLCAMGELQDIPLYSNGM